LGNKGIAGMLTLAVQTRTLPHEALTCGHYPLVVVIGKLDCLFIWSSTSMCNLIHLSAQHIRYSPSGCR
jgi:hypothetical protein